MKRLLYLFGLVLLVLLPWRLVWGYGIVNNSGTSSEDSLTVPVLCLDSAGNPITCDSFFVITVKSGANDVMFRDSGTIAMTGLDSTVMAGKTYYYFHRAVADIDGAGAVGQYVGFVTAKDNTGPMLTTNKFTFQIVNTQLSPGLDSAGLAAQYANRWSTAQRDSLLAATNASFLAKIWNIAFSTGFTAGSMGDSLTNLTYMSGITDDTTLLDWLRAAIVNALPSNAVTSSQLAGSAVKKILDSLYARVTGGAGPLAVVARDTTTKGDTVAVTGANKAMRLKSLTLSGANGSTGSFYITNSTGPGLVATSSYNSAVLGTGALFKSDYASGAYFLGGANSPSVTYQGTGTGPGALFMGGDGAGADGIHAEGGTGGANGVHFARSGATYRDLQVSYVDSGAFQGSASGLTEADIWSYANRTVTGGAVDSNRTEQSGGIADGDKSLTLYAVDTSGTPDTLSGVFVTLQNASGVVAAALETNSSGSAEVVVPDGLWRVLASKNGYCFSDSAFYVTGNDTVVIAGYDVAVPAPPTASTCRVYGYIYDVNGRPEAQAQVAAYLPAGVVRSGGAIVSPFSVSTVTDSAGFFFLDLIPSDVLVPLGALYEVTISRRDGTILRRRLEIPDVPTWQLTW